MGTAKNDYYQVLGINKDASESDIKSAFRKLSRQWHPDLQSGKTDAEKKEAEEKFKEIAEAYEVLSDKDKRSQYDTFGFDRPGMSGFSSGTDMDEFMRRHASMFSSMFGDMGESPFAEFGFGSSHRRQKPKFDPHQPEDGRHVQIDVDLTFKESIFGCTKPFDIDFGHPCSHCHGTGIENASDHVQCPKCHGAGMFVQQQQTPFGISITQTVCPDCHGSGTKYTRCSKCNGAKRISTVKHIDINVPAGIASGQRLRLAGKGQCGVCGGQDGNLYVNVHVQPSDIFVRDGNDICLIAHVSPVIASLGGKIEIPTLKSFKNLAIPAGTHDGQVFKIPHEGVTNDRNFLVKIAIEPIENLTEDQKTLLKKLEKTLTPKNNPHYQEIHDKANVFYSEKIS